MLVCWLEEETLNVVPSSNIAEGQTATVGSFCDVKWGSKYYEGEILSISSWRLFFVSYQKRLLRFDGSGVL